MRRIFILIALLISLSATFAAQKQYVLDYLGVLTESELETLNNRARSINEKHHFNVYYCISNEERDTYASTFLEERIEGFAASNGFVLYIDKNKNVWIPVTSNSRLSVLDKVEDDFYKIYLDSAQKSYFEGIMAYLNAADDYLTGINAKSRFRSAEILDDYLNPFILSLTAFLIAMSMLSRLWSISKRKFISIRIQKRRNNFRSVIMLAYFPCIVFYLSWMSAWICAAFVYDDYDMIDPTFMLKGIIIGFIFCIVWFIVAYYLEENIISSATDSKPLERRENKRVYNLVENLCMSINMAMPKINVIEDESLNAFASGINNKSYTVTLSSGMIDKLDDAELEAVIAHELSHIRNNDVKMLTVFIIFMGIFIFLSYAFILAIKGFRNIGVAILFLIFGVFIIFPGYFLSSIMRFSVSRKREYLADAGSAEMTRNPLALAAALRKISVDPFIEAVERKDIAQLFIHNPLVRKGKKKGKEKKGLFATHPPIEKRIKILEQF